MEYIEIIVLLCLVVVDLVTAAIKITQFEPLQQWKTIGGAVPIATYTACSIVHCAGLCGIDSSCTAFTIDRDSLSTSSEVECNLLNTYVTSGALLASSNLYYAQVRQPGINWTDSSPVAITTTTMAPTTTTIMAPTTTPTTAPTTSGSQQIVDIVYGITNLCTSSSQKDFVVLTSTGTVYYYDDIGALTSSGPCKSEPFSNLFDEYTDLPSISDVTGVLLFQQTNVELYTATHVRRWQAQGNGDLVKAGFSTQTLDAFLGSAAKIALDAQGGTVQWATRRTRNGVERHFNCGNEDFVLVTQTWGTFQYQTLDDVFDPNGFNLNPFGSIPPNIVAVTGYTDQFDVNYALVDASGQVFSYFLNHGTDNNDPGKQVTLLGTIQF